MRYADVAATLALVLATGGTALAAHHYLIHSVKQISPSVRAQLRGRRGPAGPPGPAGGGGGAISTFESVKDAPVTVASTDANKATGIGALALGPGSYQVVAKVHLYSIGGTVEQTPTNCVLSGAGENDTARATMNFSGIGGLDAMLTMVATAHLISPGRVFVACWRDNTRNTVNANELKIAAVQAASASSVPSG